MLPLVFSVQTQNVGLVEALVVVLVFHVGHSYGYYEFRFAGIWALHLKDKVVSDETIRTGTSVGVPVTDEKSDGINSHIVSILILLYSKDFLLSIPYCCDVAKIHWVQQLFRQFLLISGLAYLSKIASSNPFGPLRLPNWRFALIFRSLLNADSLFLGCLSYT